MKNLKRFIDYISNPATGLLIIIVVLIALGLMGKL